MPFYKYTMIFNFNSGISDTNTTPIRTGGWSESYYADDVAQGTQTAFVRLIQARLGICPRGTSISRWRVQQLEPTGPASLRRVSFSAPNTWLSDVPQMALKVPFRFSELHRQNYREFRGIPDVQITSGEYTPTAPFTVALQAFFAILTNSPFRYLRRDEEQVQSRIQAISVGGVVTMIEAGVNIAVGTRVQVLRTISPTTGRRFGYFATVTALTDSRNFTIAGEDVKASAFGKLRRASNNLTAFLNPQLDNLEAVVRKVGRPFKAYSGRASKRR